MIARSRTLSLGLLLGLVGCGEPPPGLWANTSSIDYADYCTIEFCDSIETSAEPECTCPCTDDSNHGDDDCTGGDCPPGGGGGGGGGDDDCTGGDCPPGGGDDCTGGDCPPGGGGGGGGGSGCTLTQGYWKNHNEFRTQPKQAIDWPAPLDEADLLCGRKLLDILHTVPRGEAWYILAHQYIAASLNVAAGASATALGSALGDAGALLLANCDGITTDRQVAIDLSYLLDSFNNGLIGPGHCD